MNNHHLYTSVDLDKISLQLRNNNTNEYFINYDMQSNKIFIQTGELGAPFGTIRHRRDLMVSITDALFAEFINNFDEKIATLLNNNGTCYTPQEQKITHYPEGAFPPSTVFMTPQVGTEPSYSVFNSKGMLTHVPVTKHCTCRFIIEPSSVIVDRDKKTFAYKWFITQCQVLERPMFKTDLFAFK